MFNSHKDCSKFRANIIMRIVETHSHFNGFEHLLVENHNYGRK